MPKNSGSNSSTRSRTPPQRVGVRIVEAIHVPAIRRDLADGVHTVVQQSPERVRAVRPAREPAPDADDGDRLGAAPLVLIQFGPQLPELQDGALRRRELVNSLHASVPAAAALAA